MSAATWHPGECFAFVWDSGIALIAAPLPEETVACIWDAVRTGRLDLGGFLSVVTESLSTNLLSLPPFAVALLESSAAHVAVRGAFDLLLSTAAGEVHVTGRGVSTWSERILDDVLAISARHTVPGDAAGTERHSGLPLQAGVVLAGHVDLSVGESAHRERAKGEGRGAAGSIVSSDEPGPDEPHESLGAGVPTVAPKPGPSLPELGDVHDAPPGADVRDDSAAGGVDVMRPLPAADREDEALGGPAHALSSDQPESSDPSESLQSDRSESAWESASDAAAPGPEPEPHDSLPGATPLGPEPEGLEARSFGPEPEGPAATRYDYTGRSLVEVAEPLRPQQSSIDDEMILAVPGRSRAPEPPAALVIQPSAGMPSTGIEPGSVGPLGDHDGHTVVGFSLALAPQPAGVASGSAQPGMVLALVCPQGHPNRPSASFCRDCGSPLSGVEPSQIPCPPLGYVRSSSGDRLPLAAPILAGRTPRAARVQGTVLPILLPLPYPHISSNHVEIRTEGWSVFVTDLDSRNGTYLLRRGDPPVRITRRLLVCDGDVLDLGHGVSLAFEGLP